MKAIVIGGAGYVGGHLCKALAGAGIDFLVYDNLSTGHADFVRWSPLVQGDINDTVLLKRTMEDNGVDTVFHFAAKAYVGESVVDPEKYYVNNVRGSISLLEAMRGAGVRHIVFSSTCAVYGQPDRMPINEQTTPLPINPYGRTKLMIESALADYSAAYGIVYAALRYFNAAGADRGGEIGELHDPEPHVIPRILMAAAGQLPAIEVMGTDYPTPDGTAVRDYIHVDDLAEFHLRAVRHIRASGESITVNLGTGAGKSVRELIDAAERVTGCKIPVIDSPRRPGDPPSLVADPAKAEQLLGYRAQYSDVDTVMATAWQWLQQTSAVSSPSLQARA
ncbi:UDP-glucose 4-epimerase GalE [Sphingomonas sp. HITSZ_GF]|uniref:UDP-glucose 4-epimerase GalE n=1 Tax=Sphingomonas sp. HITSZ_GF TaxID=3037247 RepID=UPI00240DAA25|nr:UDP-glucose 4-epimerase GalE [Sphingomonas sp. HITSZ_GF]MDG2535769.1 UDP-glucose 4-epimerase GalE [Sphingomonas sp. HITSZ_GF]